jgi:hypothetical protein
MKPELLELKQKLIDFMGSDDFTVLNASKKTGISVNTIKNILAQINFTSKKDAQKIFELFGVQIMKGRGVTHDILLKYSYEYLLGLSEKYLYPEIIEILNLKISLSHFSKIMREKGIKKFTKKNKGVSRQSVPVVREKKIKKPTKWGSVDPISRFDLKAELKKIREKKS